MPTVRRVIAGCCQIPGRPLLLISAFVFLVACVVGPWGNYPINDDWQYAHVAKQLAQTGRLTVDVPIAPALVGQVVLSA